MQFRFYDEVDPEQVNELMLMCHGEPATPRKVASIRRTDPNCSPWFRMYAVEGGKVVSQVGAQYPHVETTEGRMKAGFVEAVASHPNHGRQGYSKKLMVRVHEQMAEDGVDLYILGTSRTLVASHMYPKLGYHDILDFSWGKKPGGMYPSMGITTKVRRHKVDDMEKMFNRFTKGCLGFVHRQKDYPKAKCSWAPYYSKAVTFYMSGKAIGYALVGYNDLFLRIRELVTPDLGDFAPCLRTLERRFKRPYVTRSLTGRSDLLDEYRANGFREPGTWGTLMAMDPKGRLGPKPLRVLLGIDKGLFQIFSVDTY
jgi:GNAT superfamily N-acetyltransferase